MFEPIHGSAPKHAGKGVVCPLAAISAVELMLRELGYTQAADRIDRALGEALRSGKIRSLSTSSGMKTHEYTDVLLSYL
jgi:isocitrate/isopropylmalate dehydrogenase